jgi:hypothetical protein
MDLFKEEMPTHLEDTTTALYSKGRKHTVFTYLFCIIIRIILGLLIYYKVSIFKYLIFLIPLFLSFIIFTGYKFNKTQNKTWKVYLRTLLVSVISIIISILNKNENNNISGLLIIIDSLLGLQSRHSTSVLFKADGFMV